MVGADHSRVSRTLAEGNWLSAYDVDVEGTPHLRHSRRHQVLLGADDGERKLWKRGRRHLLIASTDTVT